MLTLTSPLLHVMPRSAMLKRFFAVAASSVLWTQSQSSLHCNAFAIGTPTSLEKRTTTADADLLRTVAYRAMNVHVGGVDVPVAMWYSEYATKDPMLRNVAKLPVGQRPTVNGKLTYKHKISIQRIGQLLAGWEFIPSFATKEFRLQPTLSSVVDGDCIDLPSCGPVVLLAHGYLGSRFDLSHLAEALAIEGRTHASQFVIVHHPARNSDPHLRLVGFICLSPEYPESLAASYDIANLDRTQINDQLLKTLTTQWNIRPASFGIVGHSLGTGTALNTGDDTWARVCIAGFPRRRDGSKVEGNVMFIVSSNDSTFSRNGGKYLIPDDFAMLTESEIPQHIPPRAALLFDGPGAPNHISFLAGGVNNAMVSFLSPLLPLAQAMKIPVLDFDKYAKSQDSRETAAIVIPWVTGYLKQQMKVSS